MTQGFWSGFRDCRWLGWHGLNPHQSFISGDKERDWWWSTQKPEDKSTMSRGLCFFFTVISVNSCLIKLWFTGKLSSSQRQTMKHRLIFSSETCSKVKFWGICIWKKGLLVQTVSLQPYLMHQKDSSSDFAGEQKIWIALFSHSKKQSISCFHHVLHFHPTVQTHAQWSDLRL